MPNRRRFLQAAAALSAAPAIGGAASAASADRKIAMAIYDERYVASRAFGQAALTLGARVRRINGDITGLWTGELYGMWREQPAAIAGLTVRSAMFCLEQLAWDAQMRVVHRAAHGADADRDWPVRTAQALLTQPVQADRLPAMLTMAESEADEDTLYSWIIAPATSRARQRSA
jgi:hypothetical protein